MDAAEADGLLRSFHLLGDRTRGDGPTSPAGENGGKNDEGKSCQSRGRAVVAVDVLRRLLVSGTVPAKEFMAHAAMATSYSVPSALDDGGDGDDAPEEEQGGRRPPAAGEAAVADDAASAPAKDDDAGVESTGGCAPSTPPEAEAPVSSSEPACMAAASSSSPPKPDSAPRPWQQEQQQHQQQQQQSTTQPPEFRTRHVALLFHYDGSPYSGFAENVGYPSDSSVEKALFAALTKTCLIDGDRTECCYSRAGRTDRGVSAWGQVVALRLRSAVPLGSRLAKQGGSAGDEGGNEREYGREVEESDLPSGVGVGAALDVWAPPRAKKDKKKKDKKTRGTNSGKKGDAENGSNGAKEQQQDRQQQRPPPAPLIRRTIHELNYPQILNNVLPPTIRILGWCPVTLQFSARFSCSDRTYRYHFVRRDLDLNAMREGLEKLKGKHDFRNLCKMNVEQVCNFERVVKGARIVVPNGDGGGSNDGDDGDGSSNAEVTGRTYRQVCHVEIVGQAFLWHQIRCIMAILFLIGKGLEPPSVIDDLLDVTANPGKPSYPMAPELPLVLHRCGYGDRVPFRHSVRNLWGVACDLERRWEELTLAAARVRDGLDSLKEEAEVTVQDLDGFVGEVQEERRRKGSRRGGGQAAAAATTTTVTAAAASGPPDRTTVSWAGALGRISLALGIRPSSDGPREVLHVPLLERSRGTTYEEKVRAIITEPSSAAAGGASTNEDGGGGGPSKRRRERFEDNIVKKRKTDEEDRKFYELMLRQGGT